MSEFWVVVDVDVAVHETCPDIVCLTRGMYRHSRRECIAYFQLGGDRATVMVMTQGGHSLASTCPMQLE